MKTRLVPKWLRRLTPKKREALWSKIVQAAQHSGTQPEGRHNWPQENRIKEITAKETNCGTQIMADMDSRIFTSTCQTLPGSGVSSYLDWDMARQPTLTRPWTGNSKLRTVSL